MWSAVPSWIFKSDNCMLNGCYSTLRQTHASSGVHFTRELGISICGNWQVYLCEAEKWDSISFRVESTADVLSFNLRLHLGNGTPTKNRLVSIVRSDRRKLHITGRAWNPGPGLFIRSNFHIDLSGSKCICFHVSRRKEYDGVKYFSLPS